VLAPLVPAAPTGRALVPRERFLAELRHACASRSGYAAGKLGVSERAWLQYPLVLTRERDATRRRAFELVLAYKSLPMSGIFPDRPAFYERWAAFYVEQVRSLDSIGVFEEAASETFELIESHGLDAGKAVHFKDHQPDRSSPSIEERCYLPAFRGLDLLLVCPFAEFLAERATRETFEAVWAKTGKRWFHPRSVQALEFPYGHSPATQARYPTALELLDDLKRQLATRSFDVALIAAGGCGIPLASFVKAQGRIGISLGGPLQPLFGVLGARWRSKESWRERYYNEAWVELPARYVPAANQSLENYW
jgi:hypothetical protein